MGLGYLGVNTSESRGTDSNLAATSMPVESFVCPSLATDSNVFVDFGNGSVIKFEKSSYRGISGTDLDFQFSPDGRARDGIMYRDSGTRQQDIRDGASNTVLLMEAPFGLWGDGGSACTRIADDDGNGIPDWGADGNAPSRFPSTFNSYLHTRGVVITVSPGSWHSSVVNAALADGSTRSVSNTIDFKVLRAIASRSGNERESLSQ